MRLQSKLEDVIYMSETVYLIMYYYEDRRGEMK